MVECIRDPNAMRHPLLFSELFFDRPSIAISGLLTLCLDAVALLRSIRNDF